MAMFRSYAQCDVDLEVPKIERNLMNIVYEAIAHRKLDHPVLPKYPGNLNDSLCSSSSTEAGVLIAIIGYSLTSPVGGTYYQWRDPNPTKGSENPLTYPAAFHQ
ncbi:hypothetical protein AVEN_108133-1 [Araneus ventricosus]|uniref:Uncharacterized protein n=1 Tax=Araneus ventricosus TaxID=182803 RepID=A0A4Y2WEJ5_ARAVE|nr:hypothetical protein AVEN_108133-1 [Araneus ventricosus]